MTRNPMKEFSHTLFTQIRQSQGKDKAFAYRDSFKVKKEEANEVEEVGTSEVTLEYIESLDKDGRRELYKEATGKNLSNAKVNDVEWILDKINS